MKRRTGIYKRGRIYWIHYMLNGRQCLESSRSTKLRDAEGLLLKRKMDVVQGRMTTKPSQAPLLSTVVRMYIAQIANPNTQKRYCLSERALLEYLGDQRITNLNPAMFDGFKNARTKAGVSPAGVNRDLAVARASLNLAVERRLIPYSPFTGVKLFEESKYQKLIKTLSFSDERTLLGCCDLRLRTLVVLLVESGMRVGIEALPLRWSDIDFGESAITVVRSKTPSGRRLIPMTFLCKSALLEWCSVTGGSSEYVFFNPQRPTVHILSVKTAWHNALNAAGLMHLPIYNCRHTFATRLAAAGVSDTIIDQLLGHSPCTILRFYTATVPEYLRDAVRRLEQLRDAKTHDKSRGPAVLDQTAKGSAMVQ